MADDETLSTNVVSRMIAESLHRKPCIWHIPSGLVRATAKTGDLLHLPFNSERLKKLTENYCVANTKIKAAMEITKMPVSAKDGLIRTFSAFRMR